MSCFILSLAMHGVNQNLSRFSEVLPARQSRGDVPLAFFLVGPQGAMSGIPASASYCMNFNGTDYWARPYKGRPIVVQRGSIVPLWISVAVPPTTEHGAYSGNVLVSTTVGGRSFHLTVVLNLTVAGPVRADGGDDESWRGSSLRVLNHCCAEIIKWLVG